MNLRMFFFMALICGIAFALIEGRKTSTRRRKTHHSTNSYNKNKHKSHHRKGSHDRNLGIPESHHNSRNGNEPQIALAVNSQHQGYQSTDRELSHLAGRRQRHKRTTTTTISPTITTTL